MQLRDNQIERILVRGTNWIGDAVMAAPALQRLRSSFPEADLVLLAAPRTVKLFEDSPLVDEIVEFRRQDEGLRAFTKALKMIRARRFDLAVLFQNAFEAALLMLTGGVKLRIGFAEQGRGPLLTHQLRRGPEHRNRHQTQDYLEIVAECERVCLGPDFKPPPPPDSPALTASARQQQDALALIRRSGLEAHAGPLIVLNAGATNSRAKCWPEGRYAALADRLIAEFDARIVLIGAASERAQAEEVVRGTKHPGVINLAGQTGMGELIGLLGLCDLLVSNDTGPAHIAAALGRPTLTVFGPTNEFETAPLGLRAEIVRAEGIECARCMRRECPIDHRCMTRVSADEVWERARALLRTLI
ncbi:MAG TPA: lipopolysaccharide heptosyltransferase II [Blastocatellia bacterium]|nr:lipopolysaccharide heptosyltransferase II [Blastocatellia bacterium]